MFPNLPCSHPGRYIFPARPVVGVISICIFAPTTCGVCISPSASHELKCISDETGGAKKIANANLTRAKSPLKDSSGSGGVQDPPSSRTLHNGSVNPLTGKHE